jgi:hypothetical protein
LERRFGNKFFGKENPVLKITALLKSHKPMDVIILSQENQGYLLPRNSEGLAQEII